MSAYGTVTRSAPAGRRPPKPSGHFHSFMKNPQVEVTTDSESLARALSDSGARFCRAAHTLSRPGPDPDWGVGWAGGGGRSNFTMPTSAVAPAGGPGRLSAGRAERTG